MAARTGGCIVRVVNAQAHTKGWQARVYTAWPRYVSQLFSDRKCGGQRQAYQCALEALPRLARKAGRVRRQHG